MRHSRIITFLAFLALLTISSDIFGQAQIYTRKEKLKDLTAKTVKVVMTGDEMLDEAPQTERNQRLDHFPLRVLLRR